MRRSPFALKQSFFFLTAVSSSGLFSPPLGRLAIPLRRPFSFPFFFFFRSNHFFLYCSIGKLFHRFFSSCLPPFLFLRLHSQTLLNPLLFAESPPSGRASVCVVFSFPLWSAPHDNTYYCVLKTRCPFFFCFSLCRSCFLLT